MRTFCICWGEFALRLAAENASRLCADAADIQGFLLESARQLQHQVSAAFTPQTYSRLCSVYSTAAGCDPRSILEFVIYQIDWVSAVKKSFVFVHTCYFQFKGTFTRELTWIKWYGIIRKFFSMAVEAHQIFFIFIKETLINLQKLFSVSKVPTAIAYYLDNARCESISFYLLILDYANISR